MESACIGDASGLAVRADRWIVRASRAGARAGCGAGDRRQTDPLKFSHDGPLLLIYQVKPDAAADFEASGRPSAPVWRRATKTRLKKFGESLVPYKVANHRRTSTSSNWTSRPRRSATTRWRFCTTPITSSVRGAGLFSRAEADDALQQEIRRHGRRGVHRDPAVAANQSRRVRARQVAAFGFSTGRPLRRRPVFFDESKLGTELSEEDL